MARTATARPRKATASKASAAPDAPAAPEVQRIGLLFVHGIGEQKRFEHLKASVSEFAELMANRNDTSCSVVDRTHDWKHAAGTVDPDGIAPITLNVRSGEQRFVFECHEAWWADLGARAGLTDSVKFWLWGFGQWCAPIYCDMDATGLSKNKGQGQSNTRASNYVNLPRSVAATWREPWSRFQLMIASLTTMFISATWVLAKRLFGKLLGAAPSPVLLVRYVGDVRTYEERAVPGDTAVSDPGYPRRVGIRRRMVTEMVALGSRPDLDRWYVLAHSQGTVLAYNGLTEIGHALPNYLPEAQWRALPAAYRTDDHCRRRPDKEITTMMPARQHWLADDDVINRALLFKRLAGFLTYGSPLNKFAGLWPRIVATATDRTDDTNPFPESCRWINLRAAQDPVAGNLSSFSRERAPEMAKHLPRLENYDTPFRFDYLLAHIKYFAGTEPFIESAAAVQRRKIACWLMGEPLDIRTHALTRILGLLLVFVAYLVILALLAAVAVGFVTAAGGVAAALLNRPAPTLESCAAFLAAARLVALPVLDLALALMLGSGLLRWFSESRLDARFTRHSARKDTDPGNAEYWRRVLWLHHSHMAFAAITALGTIAALLWIARWPGPWLQQPWVPATLGIAALVAALLQTLGNLIVRRQ